MGSYAAAIEAYSRALALDPRHIKALQWRGHALSLLGRNDEAEADFAAAILLLEASSPEDLAVWGGERRAMLSWTLIGHGRVLDALGRHEEARRAREAARALDG